MIGGDQLPNAMELRTTYGDDGDARSRLLSYPCLALDSTVTSDSRKLTLYKVQLCSYHTRLSSQHTYNKVLSSIINVPTGDATNNCGVCVATFRA